MSDYLSLIGEPDDPQPGEAYRWGDIWVTVASVRRGIGERVQFRADDGRLLQCGLAHFKRHAVALNQGSSHDQ